MPVRELQIDFDCAASKLEGYRTWVNAIRRRIAPVPVVITALPNWLDRKAFGALTRAADGVVLQVHSLERPSGPDVAMTLCDPAAARAAVERCARLGRPFRVALPTYGYVLGFDPKGKLLGVSAEGPVPAWPPDTRCRELRADASAMAQLVRDWTASRPAVLTGIIWYRLPIKDDELNWQWATLLAVMAGRTPRPVLRVQVRHAEPAMSEVDLVNDGDADGPSQVTVDLQWKDATLVAADALNGFERRESTDGRMRLGTAESPRSQCLPAGQTRTIGWMRLSKDTEVQGHVIP